MSLQEEQLKDVGEQPEQIEQQPTRTYSQEEYDNAIASAKRRIENKIDKNYVSREEYDALNAKYVELEQATKTPQIKEEFIKAGGNKDAFNDFIKLNGGLYQSQDLAKDINEISKKSPYMFNKSFQASAVDTQVQGKPQNNFNGKEFYEGSLLRK